MVKFAKELARSRYIPWADYYLNYKKLKKLLKRSLEITPGRDEGESARLSFKTMLEEEIEKVALFFLKQQGELAAELLALQKVRSAAVDSGDAEEINSVLLSYRVIGERVCELVTYICLNVTAVRKILKKHDKNYLDYALISSFWAVEVGRTDFSHLPQLYRYDGISAIVATIRGGLVELKSQGESKSTYGSALAVYNYNLESDPTIISIEKARNQLNQKSEYTKTMAVSSGLFLYSDADADDSQQSDAPSKRRDRLSSALNLLSTFLYMTNYYIVAPTSGKYAAALGGDPALAGLLIGATPAATLFSTVLYSWWANRSYKSAIIFASVCSLLGNVLYSVALPYDSLSMAMAGRVLNGLGGARAVNRRYIADATPREDRTAASAEFVTAGALGMSTGPALAAVFGWAISPSTSTIWTEETAPGWVMGILWTVYIIVAYTYFEEPPRFENKAKPMTELSALLSSPQSGRDELAKESLTEPVAKMDSKWSKPKQTLWSNVPVMTTLGLYFVLKLVLESLFSSCPSVTEYYFAWDSTISGSYLAVLGVLIFPANLCLARLSYRYDDRDIIWTITVAMVISIVGIVSYAPHIPYTAPQYVCFGVSVFITTNVLEGACMSLLSKTIPASYARGTFNSGFLATESGTAGRAIGDVFISYVGAGAFGLILNGTFSILFYVTLVTLVALRLAYPNLLEQKDSEDEESM